MAETTEEKGYEAMRKQLATAFKGVPAMGVLVRTVVRLASTPSGGTGTSGLTQAQVLTRVTLGL